MRDNSSSQLESLLGLRLGFTPTNTLAAQQALSSEILLRQRNILLNQIAAAGGTPNTTGERAQASNIFDGETPHQARARHVNNSIRNDTSAPLQNLRGQLESSEGEENPDRIDPTKDQDKLSASGRRNRLLYMPCDDDVLCRNQVLLRKQVEFFEANKEEANTTVSGRRKPVIIGQVGIQCRYCAKLPIKQRQKGSVYFPARLHCIYQAAQNIAASHLTSNCQFIDLRSKTDLIKYKKAARTKGHGGKKYWAKTAEAQGIKETPSDGLIFTKAAKGDLSTN